MKTIYVVVNTYPTPTGTDSYEHEITAFESETKAKAYANDIYRSAPITYSINLLDDNDKWEIQYEIR